jgi:hypothetical protein
VNTFSNLKQIYLKKQYVQETIMYQVSWDKKITKDDFPKHWQCPECNSLMTLDRENFNEIESTRSVQGRAHPDWWIDWIEGHIFGTLICGKKSCLQEIAFYGKTTTEVVSDPDTGEPTGESLYSLEYFSPPLHIFNISKKVPPVLVTEIEAAFSLYWSDTLSCSNRIRTCVELIVDKFRIPRKTVKKPGKDPTYLSLQSRLNQLRPIEPELVELMEAIKWTGNTGSHGSKVTDEDLITGFELLNRIIEEVYDEKTKKLHEKAKKINERKKPLSTVKKRKKV